MSVLTYDQEEVEVGGHSYVLQAMGAEYGMTVMDEMFKSGGVVTTKRMVDVIRRSVTYQGRQLDEKSFNIHFSRRYNDIGILFEKIIAFNFGEEGEDTLPLDQTENQSQEDITEN